MRLLPAMKTCRIRGEVMDEDTFARSSRMKPYTRSELKKLWLRFADEADADQRLSDFAGCHIDIARAMIASFSSSAAAQRAAKADEERTKGKDQPRSRGHAETPETATEDEGVADDVTVPADVFPQDALVAAVLNQVHGFTEEIIAEGRKFNGRQCVMVEKTHDENGRNCFRTKHVVYSFHRSRSAAIKAAEKAARAGKINLLTFGDSDHEE